MKLWSIAVGGAAAVTAAGVIVSLATGNPTTPTPTTASAPADSAPQTGGEGVREVHGVPVGYPHTQAGAKAAAANYTTVSGSSDFLTDKNDRHRAVSVMAAKGTARTAMKKADHAAGQTVTALRGDNSKVSATKAISRTGVLSAHILGFDAHGAMVRLWTTTVRGSAAGHATPTAGFQSVTVTLIWESDDWKLKDSSSTTGLVAPIDSRQASNVTSDFSDYVPAAAEDPVLSGSAGQDGFPAPYAHNERGARAAAVSATMLYGDPRFFTDEDWRHRMLSATAADSVLDSVTSDTDSTARLVMENRGVGADGKTAEGSELITRTAALATRSISYSDQAASIELWTASVGGVAGTDETQRPQIAFLRMTVDLVWEGSTWKTTAVTASDPLVPSPPTMQEADSAESFADVGGTSNAPATA
ncbi:hypothetical protein [Streptomyces scabiei]|uniref:hypothetical protein n=1 Tax=Streptomyces scabiei TaxID=1930 RepID=UPI0029B28BBB|nr:hypothetical protein [Streptomyces scabiei]MDX2531588.1 hypothetical protein [Streptomyces scabiei]MDX2796646.1 hypothetical protein [Streptomyces scabiei]MDX2856153.1 hypothetical protein [Streptomyces scabiei]MDX3824566.1 hypothetical protein [Streptomyces scabiei]